MHKIFASKNMKDIGRSKAKEMTTNGMVIIIRIYCCICNANQYNITKSHRRMIK